MEYTSYWNRLELCDYGKQRRGTFQERLASWRTEKTITWKCSEANDRHKFCMKTLQARSLSYICTSGWSIGMMTFPIYGKIKHVPNSKPPTRPDRRTVFSIRFAWPKNICQEFCEVFLSWSWHNKCTKCTKNGITGWVLQN